MTARREAAARLQRLLVEARGELDALENHHAELVGCLEEIHRPSPPRGVTAIVAVGLHGYYTAVEGLLARIARHLDESEPSGDSSHRDLLFQMASDWPGVRGEVLDEDLHARLSRLLGFRHFFRRAYGVTLDPVRLGEHVDNVVALHAPLRKRIADLLEFVRSTRAELLR